MRPLITPALLQARVPVRSDTLTFVEPALQIRQPKQNRTGDKKMQTVTFDARGPVAQAILTYGQSTDPASPHATDQLRLFSAKQWPQLPFHAEDVARERVGETLRLLARP